MTLAQEVNILLDELSKQIKVADQIKIDEIKARLNKVTREGEIIKDIFTSKRSLIISYDPWSFILLSSFSTYKFSELIIPSFISNSPLMSAGELLKPSVISDKDLLKFL